MLSEIEKIYLNKSIFISGSISKYNNTWKKEDVNEFCYGLSKELVSKDYKIFSGFGLGIGSNIINGALDEIYKNKFKHINEHLGLHPFPQSDIGDISLEERWTQNRRDMISEVGICIFIFGNKEMNGEIVPANGMLEEFKIAKEMNKIIIPVGGTGEAALKIFEIMRTEDREYGYLNDYWDLLKSNDKKSLLNTLVSIIASEQS